MDVSNASGYDGATVAADACFVAKHATGRTQDRAHRGDEPAGAAGRQDLRAAASGSRWSRCRTRAASPIPTACARPRVDAAAVIFQQPNFFGCLEPAPGARRGRERRTARMPIAHVDLDLASACSRRPGNYGCALAIGEGQSAGNAMSYGGPHYGFLARAASYIRRLPGRIVGETVDAAGERGYVLTLQTREQHIRREKATSNITTNQTLLALAGLVHLSLLGPQGLRELGETCMALGAYAKERLPRRGLELLFPEQATFKEFAVAPDGDAPRGDRAARGGTASTRATPLGRDYPGLDDALLVAVTERRTVDGDRPARRRRSRHEADLREVAARPARHRRPAARPAGARGARPGSRAQAAAAAARARRARGAAPLHRALDAQLRRSTPASTRSAAAR